MTKPRYAVALGGVLFAMAMIPLLTFSGLLPEGSLAFWTWFSMATSALCFYAMKADKAKPFVRPATAFLLYNVLLNFGLIVPYVLIGPETIRDFAYSVRVIVESSHLIPSICLGNIAVISFALAVLLTPKKPADADQKALEERFTADGAFVVSLLAKLCLVTTLLFFGFHVLSGGTELFASYQAFMRSSAYRSGLYPWVLLLYAIGTVCVALLPGNGGHTFEYALWLLIALFFLLNGNKGEVLYAALAGVGAYGLNGGKIKRLHVFATLFIMFAFLPFITSFREKGAVENLAQIGLDVSGTFVEIGSQIRTTIYTLEDLRSNAVQTLFGASYYQPIVNIAKSALFFVPFRANVSATAQMRALHPNAGFNQVAESYLNFGVPGVIVFFAMTGWILSTFENRRLPLLQVAYLGWIATILINASRNHFSFVPGQIAVVSLLYYASVRLLKSGRSR